MSKASYAEIAAAIYELIKDGHGPNELAGSVAAYLIEERRTNELDKIMRQLRRRRLEDDGILEITAVSVYELNRDIQKQISLLYKSPEILITQERDKKLIGGVRLTTLDSRLDLSVQGRLKLLRKGVKG